MATVRPIAERRLDARRVLRARRDVEIGIILLPVRRSKRVRAVFLFLLTGQIAEGPFSAGENSVDTFASVYTRGKTTLTGVGDVLDARALAAGRAAHTVANLVADLIADLHANLGGVEVELGEGAAEGVAVHAQFIGCLALIPLMVREHFEDVALLELAHGVRVGDAGVVHLRDKTVKFALQSSLTYQPLISDCSIILASSLQLDPIGCSVLEVCDSV